MSQAATLFNKKTVTYSLKDVGKLSRFSQFWDISRDFSKYFTVSKRGSLAKYMNEMDLDTDPGSSNDDTNDSTLNREEEESAERKDLKFSAKRRRCFPSRMHVRKRSKFLENYRSYWSIK